MKRYIISTIDDWTEEDKVWAAIPKEYRPYIEEITIVPQHSVYRDEDVITYNATFKNKVWQGDKNPMVGIFHAEDVDTLVQSIIDYLTPKFPEIKREVAKRWHPRRKNWWF